MKQIKIPLFILDDNGDYADLLAERIEEEMEASGKEGYFKISIINPNEESFIEKILQIESPFLLVSDHNLDDGEKNENKGKDEIVSLTKKHPYILFSQLIYYSARENFENKTFEINEDLIKAGCFKAVHFFPKERHRKMLQLMPKFYENILNSFEMFSQNGILFPLWLSEELEEDD